MVLALKKAVEDVVYVLSSPRCSRQLSFGACVIEHDCSQDDGYVNCISHSLTREDDAIISTSGRATVEPQSAEGGERPCPVVLCHRQ